MIQTYIDRLGLQHATFVRIEHEDALVAQVYKVTLPDSTTYVLKICKLARHYQNEVFFLSHFASRIPVPRIIQLVPPEKDLCGAILMEYLPGELLSTQVITQNVAHELGIALAKIHSERVAAYGDIQQGPGSRHYTHAQEYVGDKFQEAFAECMQHLERDLLMQCRDYYETHVVLLDGVDGPCFAHRDFRPANIMVGDDRVQGIIDWSSSRAGFAQEDFIPMASGEWNMSPESKEALLAGYASVRPVPELETIMPLLLMIRAFFTIGYTLKSNIYRSIGGRAYQSGVDLLTHLQQKGFKVSK